MKLLGILDIFRKKDPTANWSSKKRRQHERFMAKLGHDYKKRWRKCRDCGKKVKHTCIKNWEDEDKGGQTDSYEIWAIGTHQYRQGKKCKGSNKRYTIHTKDY